MNDNEQTFRVFYETQIISGLVPYFTHLFGFSLLSPNCEIVGINITYTCRVLQIGIGKCNPETPFKTKEYLCNLINSLFGSSINLIQAIYVSTNTYVQK